VRLEDIMLGGDGQPGALHGVVSGQPPPFVPGDRVSLD
jgi:hypothetical protein